MLIVRHRSQAIPPPPDTTDATAILQAAENDLRHDPIIADVVFAPGRDQWDVSPAMGALGPVDPQGFGHYICGLLAERGAVDARKDQRADDRPGGAAVERVRLCC